MKTTIGIIGGGNMGAAIINGIRKDFTACVCEKDKKRSAYLKQAFGVSLQDLKTVVTGSQVVILAVKPQDFEETLNEVRRYVRRNHLLISIAAGITTLYIEKRLGESMRVVRTMPNLAAQVGEGITAVCKGVFAQKSDADLTCRIFNHVGRTIVVEERWLDAVTAVSGSGPAYVFLFMECLMKAAQSLGFKEDISKLLIMQTLKGSLKLIEQLKDDPRVLRERVTSKGGTTQAAMDVFLKHNIQEIFKEAILAAEKREKELAK